MYVADAGADLAEFNESSSDEQLSVSRHSSVLIPCAVPLSIPSPPLISYLRDDRPLKLTGTLTRSLAWCVPVTVFSALLVSDCMAAAAAVISAVHEHCTLIDSG